jgi:hypothetical protein
MGRTRSSSASTAASPCTSARTSPDGDKALRHVRRGSSPAGRPRASTTCTSGRAHARNGAQRPLFALGLWQELSWRWRFEGEYSQPRERPARRPPAGVLRRRRVRDPRALGTTSSCTRRPSA